MAQDSLLFTPFTQRTVTFRNRLVVSPMCMYSAEDGAVGDWHLVHLGSRAMGGAGAILMEATGVLPEGRITPGCTGIWKDEHIEGLSRIARFLDAQGTVPGIQLAHAGRKASMPRPWDGETVLAPSAGGWETVGPSATPFAPTYATPRALDEEGIARVIAAFRDAARRALAAGFRLVEVHAAHGYLLNEFLSPLVNTRTDRWGGPFEHRTRLVLEVVHAVREVWPAELPLWVRLSVKDWADGGWDMDDSVRLAALLRDAGVDLVDCSSSGNVAHQRIVAGPGFQVPFAARIKREAGVATGAVGLITSAEQAEAIVRAGDADVVLLGREALRDPYVALHAAQALGAAIDWPRQYLRARP